MRRSANTSTAIALAAITSLISACSSKAGPTGPPVQSNGAVVGTTTWDFSLLSGGDGAHGNPATFSISGQGSILASVIEPEKNPGFQVSSKGFNDAPLSLERGIGICGTYGIGGGCTSASQFGTEEIGDQFPDSTGAVALTPWMILDFTKLTAGSVVDSITLGSVELGEGYMLSTSADGVTYSLMTKGINSKIASGVVAIAVPPGTNYMKLEEGPGIQYSDYVVETVHVIPPKASTP
jgi:hypothetical protein